MFWIGLLVAGCVKYGPVQAQQARLEKKIDNAQISSYQICKEH